MDRAVPPPVAQTIVSRPCVGKATRNDNRSRRAADPPKTLWSEPLACHAGVRAGICVEERRQGRRRGRPGGPLHGRNRRRSRRNGRAVILSSYFGDTTLVARPFDLWLVASGRACPAPTPRPCRGEASPRPRATCYPRPEKKSHRAARAPEAQYKSAYE